jgi:hypothetical protein
MDEAYAWTAAVENLDERRLVLMRSLMLATPAESHGAASGHAEKAPRPGDWPHGRGVEPCAGHARRIDRAFTASDILHGRFPTGRFEDVRPQEKAELRPNTDYITGRSVETPAIWTNNMVDFVNDRIVAFRPSQFEFSSLNFMSGPHSLRGTAGVAAFPCLA